MPSPTFQAFAHAIQMKLGNFQPQASDMSRARDTSKGSPNRRKSVIP
jgi:hypothetical protein